MLNLSEHHKVVLATGGFDPLHSGHIEYLKSAKVMGDTLVVGINSDDWLIRKKGRTFMPSTERIAIIENLKMVDHCILFDDTDNTAIEAINNVKLMYPNSEIIFANGGDRTQDNIPEMSVPGVKFIFGVGGENKKNSSSWILEEWKAPKTIRPWGYYRILYDNNWFIPKETWHRLSNPYEHPCKIVEIQYGKNCSEDDIERKVI